jgi:predicted nucleotidyltransferase
MEIEEVKKNVAAIVREELAKVNASVPVPFPFHAFFFGSRIAGTASPRSDLDVGIEGPEALSSVVMRLIKARCDALPTLYTIDVVDFFMASDDFKKVAKAHIEMIG